MRPTVRYGDLESHDASFSMPFLKMFIAALTSLSCLVPHSRHIHSRTLRSLTTSERGQSLFGAKPPKEPPKGDCPFSEQEHFSEHGIFVVEDCRTEPPKGDCPFSEHFHYAPKRAPKRDNPHSEHGIFVAEDCRTKKVRQLDTAAADGTIAALAACDYIDSLK